MAIFYFLSNLLCKPLAYNQAGLSNQNHFSIFQLLVLTTMLERSQAVPSRRNDYSRINVPSWVPKNTHLACTLGTSETNPFYSCHGFQVPIQTWTPSSRTWGPTSMRCLGLHLSPPPISWPKKSRSPWQESNKPSRSHKQVCAWDNKFVTWPGSMQRTVLNRHR
jgi:hypothetical protein